MPQQLHTVIGLFCASSLVQLVQSDNSQSPSTNLMESASLLKLAGYSSSPNDKTLNPSSHPQAEASDEDKRNLKKFAHRWICTKPQSIRTAHLITIAVKDDIIHYTTDHTFELKDMRLNKPKSGRQESPLVRYMAYDLMFRMDGPKKLIVEGTLCVQRTPHREEYLLGEDEKELKVTSYRNGHEFAPSFYRVYD